MFDFDTTLFVPYLPLDIKLVIWPSCVHIMTPLEGSSVEGR